MMPWPGLLEPLTESICIGTISSFCVFNVFGIHPALFFLFHLVLWFSLDLMLIRVVEVRLLFKLSLCGMGPYHLRGGIEGSRESSHYGGHSGRLER